MTAFMLGMVLQAGVLATGANNYGDTYKEAVDSGKPLVVLVGADWCPACVSMKTGTLPEMEKQGKLSKVAFTTVNTDNDPELARQLMTGTSIPQLIVFTKTDLGWQRYELIGRQSQQSVDSLILQALEAQAPKITSTSTTVRQ